MNSLKLAIFLSSVIFADSVFADASFKHPNLKEAYEHCDEAMHYINRAYENNKDHAAFGGHASKALQLLQEAKHEIEEAEEFRNDHVRKRKD